MIDILNCTRGNRSALRDAYFESFERHFRATGRDHAVRKVAIDSFPILVHGQQPAAPYNGHYRETVYHPLLASYSDGRQVPAGDRAASVAAGFQPGLHVAD